LQAPANAVHKNTPPMSAARFPARTACRQSLLYHAFAPLVPEPDNVHDERAIAVKVGAKTIGYVNRLHLVAKLKAARDRKRRAPKATNDNQLELPLRLRGK
jgi:hypothetical protein